MAIMAGITLIILVLACIWRDCMSERTARANRFSRLMRERVQARREKLMSVRWNKAMESPDPWLVTRG